MSTTPVSTDVPTSSSLTPHSNTTFVYDNSSVFNKNGDTVQVSDFAEFKVARFLNDYYLYAVCVIGIPGNIACIITLLNMRPFLSSAVYMMSLAIVDIVAIALKVVYFQLTHNTIRLGDTGCQLTFFFGTVSQQYSNWILVAMTLERFIAIWFPFKVRTVCTRRNAVITLIVMLVFFTLANLQFVFTFEEVGGKSSWSCSPRIEYAHFIIYVWYWIDGSLYAMVPIVLITVFNSLIIHTVRMSGKTQRQLTNIAKRKSETMTQQRQVTTMLLTISIVFVILILPNCVFFIVKVYWSWEDTPLGVAQYYLVYQIVFVLSDFNHAVNFYLYCLSGLKFRRKFVQIMCCRKDVPRINLFSAVASLGRTIDMMKTVTSISAAETANTTLFNKSPVKSPRHQNGRVSHTSSQETTNLLCDKSPAKTSQNGSVYSLTVTALDAVDVCDVIADKRSTKWQETKMLVCDNIPVKVSQNEQNGRVNSIITKDIRDTYSSNMGKKTPDMANILSDTSQAKVSLNEQNGNVLLIETADTSGAGTYDTATKTQTMALCYKNPSKTPQNEQQNGSVQITSIADTSNTRDKVSDTSQTKTLETTNLLCDTSPVKTSNTGKLNGCVHFDSEKDLSVTYNATGEQKRETNNLLPDKCPANILDPVTLLCDKSEITALFGDTIDTTDLLFDKRDTKGLVSNNSPSKYIQFYEDNISLMNASNTTVGDNCSLNCVLNEETENKNVDNISLVDISHTNTSMGDKSVVKTVFETDTDKTVKNISTTNTPNPLLGEASPLDVSHEGTTENEDEDAISAVGVSLNTALENHNTS